MATSSALPQDRDELDRLVEELAQREALSPNTAQHEHALPEYVPLSHGDPFLSAEYFDVEGFLVARAHLSIADLRTELRQYHAQLKEELVKLINDDYEDFISLSTDLRDEGLRMERIKHPLADLKDKILQSKGELLAIQNAIHAKLAKRNLLREEKGLLHLLLKISDSVTRLESLLHITSPDTQDTNSLEMDRPNFLTFPAQESPGESFLNNRAKHLARVATEYSQLLYHARKAEDAQCVFVNEIRWRIERVHSTLSSDLDQLFSQVVRSLTGETRGSELERTKNLTDLTDCLQTYDNLGLWRDAEDILRKEVMRIFVKKTIYPGALAAPHSPIVPNTPFALAPPRPFTASGPQIPYTPFTAFIPRTRQSDVIDASLPQAHLLEEKDDPLTILFNQILRFVAKDMARIMDIAEKVSIKTSASDTTVHTPTQVIFEPVDFENPKRFQIMANVVWAEIGRAIMDEIGSIVFAAGRPNEFRKHYETTNEFLRSLELLAPSLDSVESMRKHSVYVAFNRRWQLPVYFQLRWKEIVASLEETLSSSRAQPNPDKEKGSFKTSQALATWLALSSCWSSDIYIPQLGHRFWKLTLQIISRYRGWVDDYLSSLDSHASAVSIQHEGVGKGPSAVPGSEAASAESIAADNALLQQYAFTIADIQLLESNALNLWRQVISEVIPEGMDEPTIQGEAALRETLSQLTSMIESLSVKITGILTKRCCEAVSQIRSVPSQLRNMSNRRTPAEPSFFIPLVLRPVKHFFGIGVPDGYGLALKDAFLKEYSTEVFNHVAQRYLSTLTAMKKQKESLRRLKKGAFSLFGASKSEEERDEERIRSQMILDAETFAKDAETLLVDVKHNRNWLALKELVYSTDSE